MILICTPTIRAVAGFTSQVQTLLACGGFTERTPQAVTSLGGFSGLVSTSGFSVSGGFDESLWMNAQPFEQAGGLTLGTTPAMRVAGGFDAVTVVTAPEIPLVFTALRPVSLIGGRTELLAGFAFASRRPVVYIGGAQGQGGGLVITARRPSVLLGGIAGTVGGFSITRVSPQVALKLVANIDAGFAFSARRPYIQAVLLAPVAGDFSAWVMTPQGGHARYDNFPFTGFALLNGVLLACAADGIYAMDADTDDGDLILASIKTAIIDCGTPNRKRVEELYIGTRSAGDLTLRLTHNEDRRQEQYNAGNGMKPLQQRRVQLSRSSDLDFNTIQVEITNPDGGDFEVTQMDFNAVPSTSRRR